MTREYVLSLDDRQATLRTVGGKGASLARLQRAGVPVPRGFHLTTTAYELFVEQNDLGCGIRTALEEVDASRPETLESVSQEIEGLFSRASMPGEISGAISLAYAGLAGEDPAVAVRSSATAEDLPEASFAGQQETFLNVRGEEALEEAVKRCWASLWTARAIGYRERRDMDPGTVSLAVVIQSMVPADAAGVLFTANPANGRRDEAVISAAWGLGESVVGGSVTPDAVVVEKETGRVISREIGDKAVMTVRAESGTEERPVPEAQRRQPVLDDEEAAELVRYGADIEDLYSAPQDIEWALSGGEFSILQARPITALPEPTADPPTDWSVPETGGMYARASIVEQMPDPLSPLFADLIEGSVVRSLEELINGLFGTQVLREGDFGFPVVNGYAYYFYRFAAMGRVLFKTPSVFRLVVGRGEDSGERLWREKFRPRYARTVEEWEAKSPEDLPATGLVAGVRELLYGGASYYTSVQMIIPLAATSETLFTGFYDRLVRREGDPPAQTYLLGFDSTPIRAEKSLYDLALWCREHPDLTETLNGVPSDQAPAGVDEAVWRELGSRLREHLDRYGHTVYNLDFVNPVPADDPGPLLDTLKFYIGGGGIDPHERQRRAVARREEATEAVLARLDAPRRRVFRRLVTWAQHIAPVREDALADVGLGWPVMRRMLFELGDRLVEAGAIGKPADVFWLKQDELRNASTALDAGHARIENFADTVEHRKMVWRGQKRVAPPQLLPKGSWTRVIEGLMPARSEEQTGDTIKGVGASSGEVTATARVLDGPADFGQMRPGDVLVASITTPAWTPLFALASAVVTDVGGPLSHGSIVAREYDIPAVLGTGVATRRIQSGQTVLVDGDAGTVTLLDGEDGADDRSSAPPSRAGAPSNGAKRAAGLALAVGAALGLAVWLKRRARG